MNKKCGTWGYDDIMVVAAFRYCLGRRTYIVQDCVNWLIDYWPQFNPGVKQIIAGDLEDEFAKEEIRLKEGDPFTFSSLGDNCDKVEWEKVRALYKETK